MAIQSEYVIQDYFGFSQNTIELFKNTIEISKNTIEFSKY